MILEDFFYHFRWFLRWF